MDKKRRRRPRKISKQDDLIVRRIVVSKSHCVARTMAVPSVDNEVF